MALELDIFQDTTANTMFADSTMAAEETAVDNARYNDEGDRLYYWVPPSELGDPKRSSEESELYKDTGGYYTEAEIRAAWDADQGMGYLKDQTDWDNYWGYLTERQDLIDDGVLSDGTSVTQAQLQAKREAIQAAGGLKASGGAKGAGKGTSQVTLAARQDAFNAMINDPAQVELMEKYGLSMSFQNDDGDTFRWNGSSYTKTDKVAGVDWGLLIAASMTGYIMGPQIAGMAGLSGGFAGGAASGAIGSVITQGIATGDVDFGQVATAGVLGGIGGFFEELRAGELGIQVGADGSAVYTINGEVMSGAQNLADTYTTKIAGLLNIPYNEASGIVEGIINGTVTGEDLEGIAINAVGGWGEAYTNQWIKDTLGDQGLDVDNLFKDGTSNISTESLQGLVSEGFDALVAGGMSETDALKAIYGFFDDGGTLDFLLPMLPKLGFPDLPDIDFCKEFPGFSLCKDGVNLPDIKCPEGWDKDEDGICIEPPVLCGEGYSWDPQLGQCIGDGFSGQVKCPDGWDRDEDGICIEPPVVCGEGYSWDLQLGECRAPDVPETGCDDVEIANGVQKYVYNTNLGECIPDVIECIEGFNLVGQECVKAEVSVQVCSDEQKEQGGIEIKVGSPDSWYCKMPDPNTTCPEGFRNEDGECVKIEGPDIDVNVDVDASLPSVSLGQPGSGLFTPLETKGLSYEQQTPTPLAQSGSFDAMAGITNFINRKLNEKPSDQDISDAFNSGPDKGMFT